MKGKLCYIFQQSHRYCNQTSAICYKELKLSRCRDCKGAGVEEEIQKNEEACGGQICMRAYIGRGSNALAQYFQYDNSAIRITALASTSESRLSDCNAPYKIPRQCAIVCHFCSANIYWKQWIFYEYINRFAICLMFRLQPKSMIYYIWHLISSLTVASFVYVCIMLT